MGRIEQSDISFSPRQKLSRYMESFPLLDSEQQKNYSKQFSTIEISTFLLQDVQTGIREEKRRLTPPNARDKQKNPILSKEVAETLLENLGLANKIELIVDDKEIEKLKTNEDKPPLTAKEKEQRKAVIGYQWSAEIVTDEQKEQVSKKLEVQIKNAKDARQAMINHNMSLVFAIARDYKLPIPEVERQQSGCVGLIRAVEKFDYRKGFEFSTYATFWIKQNIQRETYRQINDVHLVQDLKQALQTVSSEAKKYETEHGIRPTKDVLEDLVRNKNIKDLNKKDAIEILLSNGAYAIPLDAPLTEEPNSSLKEFLEDKSSIEEAVQAEVLRSAMSTLSEREKKVIGASFWLNSTEGDIATELGISKMEVFFIKGHALKKLKKDEQLTRICGETIFEAPSPKIDISNAPEITPDKSAKQEIEIPSGVKPETFAFLQAAKASGAFGTIDKTSQAIITTYFTTEASLNSIAEEIGGTSRFALTKSLLSNLNNIWEHLPPPLQKMHPKDQTISLKIKKGRKFPDEARKKISDYWRGRPKSSAWKEKQKQIHTGMTHTDESKEKMSKAKKGRSTGPFSEERRAKIAEKAREREAAKREAREKEKLEQGDAFIQIFPNPESS
jgi:RNA polymerase sigma factor (sigma-70 family)